MIVKADKNYRRASITKRRGAFIIVALAVLFMSMPKADAHEFWLEPANFAPALKTPIPVSIRVGQQFKGDHFLISGLNFAASHRWMRLASAHCAAPMATIRP